MDKRLYFELMVELSHKDTWVHYYFVCYKTFVIYWSIGQMILVRNDRVFQLFGINIVFELFKKTTYKLYGWRDSNISIPVYWVYTVPALGCGGPIAVFCQICSVLLCADVRS
jgi:hypothetical protein